MYIGDDQRRVGGRARRSAAARWFWGDVVRFWNIGAWRMVESLRRRVRGRRDWSGMVVKRSDEVGESTGCVDDRRGTWSWRVHHGSSSRHLSRRNIVPQLKS